MTQLIWLKMLTLITDLTMHGRQFKVPKEDELVLCNEFFCLYEINFMVCAMFSMQYIDLCIWMHVFVSFYVRQIC